MILSVELKHAIVDGGQVSSELIEQQAAIRVRKRIEIGLGLSCFSCTHSRLLHSDLAFPLLLSDSLLFSCVRCTQLSLPLKLCRDKGRNWRCRLVG